MRNTVNNLEKQLAETTEKLEQVQIKLMNRSKQTDDTTDKLKVALLVQDKAKEDYNALQAKYEQLLKNQARSSTVELQLTNANARRAELEKRLQCKKKNN